MERVVSTANTIFHEPTTTTDSFLARSGQNIPTGSIEEEGLVLVGESLLAGQPMVESKILPADASIFVMLASCDPKEGGQNELMEGKEGGEVEIVMLMVLGKSMWKHYSR